MSLTAGDRLPEATFRTLTPEGVKTLTTADAFAGRTVVLFAVPAAFSPTCSKTHLPGYVAHHDAIKAGGVDEIVCVSANDVWVLDEKQLIADLTPLPLAHQLLLQRIGRAPAHGGRRRAFAVRRALRHRNN